LKGREDWLEQREGRLGGWENEMTSRMKWVGFGYLKSIWWCSATRLASRWSTKIWQSLGLGHLDCQWTGSPPFPDRGRTCSGNEYTFLDSRNYEGSTGHLHDTSDSTEWQHEL